MKWVPYFLVALALGAFTYPLLHKKPKPARLDSRSENIVQNIVQGGHRDLASARFEQKINSDRGHDLVNAVAYTCLEKYNRDSCVTHLIHCGLPCKAMIPADRFAKIETDYWNLIDRHGLRARMRSHP